MDLSGAAVQKEIDASIPGLSIDCVVLGFENGRIKVLLMKWKGLDKWALPGGFIHKDEDLDLAATRILQQRTRLESIFLKQFHTFGQHDRNDDPIRDSMLQHSDTGVRKWLSQRFITIGYMALVYIPESDPKPDHLTEKCAWIDVADLPSLMLDHKEILEKALETVKVELNYLPLGMSMLSPRFTMGDLQKIYEQVLGKSLDRGNFQKKMLKLELLERHEKLNTGGAHKAPYLYSFNKSKYDDLVRKGIGYL